MPAFLSLLIPVAFVALVLVLFFTYVWIRYVPIVARIFEQAPVFQPLRAEPAPGGEPVEFQTEDGLTLLGDYYRSPAPRRSGVVVFCHEFLGNRHSAHPYADSLLDAGFDLFTFDFRNHGDSTSEPGVDPIQWVSDRDQSDLRAAVRYLQTRPDRDPAGIALFGVSRGGGVALCQAADDPSVWAVATDGAFPTHETMLSYVLRWAEIYVGNMQFWGRLPRSFFAFAAWAGRVQAQGKLHRRFPAVERAAARLGPRPWLAIHGARDAYIGPEIARDLVSRASDRAELWLVPDAKHNRCREVAPEMYRDRLSSFFTRFAPRRSFVEDAETSVEPNPGTALTPLVAARVRVTG
jgi:pimeloyl-ACP methyl ester carboxylesterase